jgi:hypothetical protein
VFQLVKVTQEIGKVPFASQETAQECTELDSAGSGIRPGATEGRAIRSGQHLALSHLKKLYNGCLNNVFQVHHCNLVTSLFLDIIQSRRNIPSHMY